MIGIILISHAHIASETKQAVEHILGVQEVFESIDVPDSDALNHEQARLKQLLKSTDAGQGVLVMVDVFGATPCNIALEVAEHDKVEVIAGFNVPTVIKAVSLRREEVALHELATLSVEAGQQYLHLAQKTNETEGKIS